MTRRQIFSLGLAGATGSFFPRPGSAAITLPQEKAFVGEEKFHAIMAKARELSWVRYDMKARMTAFGRELLGIPYVGFTLEIDDHVECPSCNFTGLDCWTYFETTLGLARLLDRPAAEHTWRGLLAEIECTRYRGGRCTGDYLERIHYLDEWFFDNDARQTIQHLTKYLPGAIRLHGRRSTEMTKLWRSYRYLKKNPQLRPRMRDSEVLVEALPVYYIPKNVVAAMETKLQDGDIIGIVTNQQGGTCSHVGLAMRDTAQVCRFVHASKNHKSVVVDVRLSEYLHKFKSHAGIMVGRPLLPRFTIRDEALYQQRLARLKQDLPARG